MSSQNVLGNELSQAQHGEHVDLDERDVESLGEAVGEQRDELRPSVEQETQGKVDTRHPDARPEGLTLEAEERMQAREWEIARTHERWRGHETDEREARTRTAAGEGSIERRREFGKRAASVDPWADPERADPRELLTRDELGSVNREAARLHAELRGWSRAAISRRLAERVADGVDLSSAVMQTLEELQMGPGHVIPIAAVGRVDRQEVDLEGTVSVLWASEHPAIRQVGLIEDETGTIKFTSWTKSRARVVREGDRVRLRNVATSWYEGRVSVAVTGWSHVAVLEDGAGR